MLGYKLNELADYDSRVATCPKYTMQMGNQKSYKPHNIISLLVLPPHSAYLEANKGVTFDAEYLFTNITNNVVAIGSS